jgi:hypothetical protein
MSASSSYRCFVLFKRSGLRTFAPAVVLVTALAAGAPAQEYIATSGPGPAIGLNLSGGVRAADSAGAFRDAVKTWGMYRIAVMQAAAGNPQDAKHTLWQIDRGPPLCPAEVTGVWFCCGQPIYDHPLPPATAVAGRFGGVGLFAVGGRRSPDFVPLSVPAGLPADYLAADPRHGAVIDFTDERDSRGTRMTSRKYADGYVVIETPRAEGIARNARGL